MRGKKGQQAKSKSAFNISGPLPGGGRDYASEAEKGVVKPTKTYDSSRYPRAQASPKSYHSQSTYDEDVLGRGAHRYENMSSGAQPKILI